MLEGAKKNIKQIEGTVEISDDVRYSIKDYNESIDEICNGTNDFDVSYIYVCDTPQFLLDIGFRKLPMLITKKHVVTDMFTEEEARSKGYKVNKNDNFHGMGDELMKEIPGMLSEPVMIIRHSTSPFDTEIGIITNKRDNYGNPIIIGITPNTKGYISVKVNDGVFDVVSKDTNNINTAYGNDKIKMFLKSAKDGNRILFLDKTKSQDINKILRVLFPNNFEKLDFSKNLAQYSSLVNGINASYVKKNSLKDSKSINDGLVNTLTGKPVSRLNDPPKMVYRSTRVTIVCAININVDICFIL